MSASPVIQTIEIKRVSFKLKSPFTTAAGSKNQTDNVQVAISLSNGIRGLAEASTSLAMPSQTQDHMVNAFKEMIPELRGKAIEDYRSLVALCWRLQPMQPTAAAAMECAILDAWTRVHRRPLAVFFGNHTAPIETDLTFSVAEPKELAKWTRQAVKKGFRRLKVKLTGNNPALDVERLVAVHRTAPRASLVADGNQGFGLSQATDFYHRLKKTQVPLVFLEQPFPRHDLRAMRLFRHRCHLPLFADESVLTAADAARLFEAEAADGVNIKVAKSGLLGALDIIRMAQRFKKRLSIGCMEESKLGLAASVHLACGTGVFEWVDLDSVFLLEAPTLRGGFLIKGPKFSVKGIGPGIGI